MKKQKSQGGARPGGAARTPFQLEMIKLIESHAATLGGTSGRSLSARLGKSSNHLWQMLNRGMVPSGPAILDIARLLRLSGEATDRLILKAIETKGLTRSRDRFWITRALEMVEKRDAEIRDANEFLAARSLTQDFSVWRESGGVRPKARRPGSVREK